MEKLIELTRDNIFQQGIIELVKRSEVDKPEPKEVWINEYKDDFVSHREKHYAIKGAHNNAVRVAVHYREVIEE